MPISRLLDVRSIFSSQLWRRFAAVPNASNISHSAHSCTSCLVAVFLYGCWLGEVYLNGPTSDRSCLLFLSSVSGL